MANAPVNVDGQLNFKIIGLDGEKVAETPITITGP